MTKPLHRQPATTRRALVERLKGLDVTLHVDSHRDGTVINDYPGTLVGVAATNNGTSSDLVIVRLRQGLRMGGGELIAMSIATVSGISVEGAPELNIGRVEEATGE